METTATRARPCDLARSVAALADALAYGWVTLTEAVAVATLEVGGDPARVDRILDCFEMPSLAG
jgi:hypothetical protein